MTGNPQGAGQPEEPGPQDNSNKFAPIDMSAYFNASSLDWGPHQRTKNLSGNSQKDGLGRTPAGKQNLRGIPFFLGPKGIDRKSWLALSLGPISWATKAVEIPVSQQARFLCLAAFCDWDPVEASPSGVDPAEAVGQKLAEVILIYEDGTEEALPIRRRFEVNSMQPVLGHLCFVATPHVKDETTKLTDPLGNAEGWGGLQTALRDANYPSGPDGRSLATVWVSALFNPFPERTVKSIRFQAASEDILFVCGLTLFRGVENPLRYERLKLYRLTLPEPLMGDATRWKIDLDLGIVGRRFVLPDFNPETWLSAAAKGIGERVESAQVGRYLYFELAASPDATLILRDERNAKEYSF
jgi:hypothetical protein